MTLASEAKQNEEYLKAAYRAAEEKGAPMPDSSSSPYRKLILVEGA